jgi:hypothetical protein
MWDDEDIQALMNALQQDVTQVSDRGQLSLPHLKEILSNNFSSEWRHE